MAGQHRAVLADEPERGPDAWRPVPGPVAILPTGSPVFADAVARAGGVLGPLSGDTRGIIWLSYARAAELGDILEQNPQVGWVQLPWAGVDAFSGVLSRHTRPDLIVTSAKGAYAQPVAEHALALVLASMRLLPERARARSWNAVPAGESLYGRTVLIVGAGGIARELIRLLAPFGTHIVVVRRSTEPVPGAARTVASDGLTAELPHADVVVLAAALTGGTRHLLSHAEFALMKPTAHLVNIARGALVDTGALVETLARGALAGAALDVTDPEPLPDGHALWTEPRCLITPHMADTPEMTAPLLAERIRLNVAALLGNGPFIGVVDPAAGY
ncbi:D-isomer specific 2-hydroxyacid dehydrogenase family protein [Cryobacterium sp. SO2]|uniref:D-isomer specific 2-hydroxyacid dehydrogenase family protein n=1 Tax=Cryobacterium sp. SO2 TaxID=1897060 RepID=UPI00223E352E|nr:D-isomer specific 2-hydroxyacid dehydrogenase family protein [Cryobacterium sp. SO2]WEO79113.1 D-isomer specific 2-hydroxyacid dehydrogenase family protein [Cryobacterium sp. SO2]